MIKVWLILAMMTIAVALSAQHIHVYGQAVCGDEPLAGVMIMIFEQDHFYKRFITGRDGGFRFALGSKDYVIMFYKPGIMPDAYHIINHMETDVLKIPIQMEMTATTLSADSVLARSPLLTQTTAEVTRAYLAAVYEYDRSRRDTVAAATRRILMRHAIEERDRFAHYHIVKKADRITTTIGPDTYDLVTDAKGAKQYYKNDKPITEVTYTFETTRRYEGVLKNKRDVRRFEKYVR